MATPEQLDDLRTKLAEERDPLLAVFRGLDEQQAEYRPPDRDGEDGWSAKEQAVHLAQMEATYRLWAQRTVAEDAPDLDMPPPAPTPEGERSKFTMERAHDVPLADIVDELVRQRDLTSRFIDGLSLEELDRRSSNKLFGELSALQWLRSYYRHDRMHVAQLQGRASEYQPRFQSGREPDQRRR